MLTSQSRLPIFIARLACARSFLGLAVILSGLLSLSVRAEDKLPDQIQAQLQQDADEQSVGLSAGGTVLAYQTRRYKPAYVAGGEFKSQPEFRKAMFPIHGVTGIFTGLLLALAVEEKKVTLETTLGEVLKGEVTFSDPKVGSITLLQLASHCSGLPLEPEALGTIDRANPYAGYNRETLKLLISRLQLAHAPPFPEAPSNVSIGILGFALSVVYKEDWETLVVSRICTPLHLADTRVTLNDDQKKRLVKGHSKTGIVNRWDFADLKGSAGLCSTPDDMLTLARSLAKPELTPLKDAIEFIKQPRSPSFGLCIGRTEMPGSVGKWAGFQSRATGHVCIVMANSNSQEAYVVMANSDRVLINKAFPQASSPPATIKSQPAIEPKREVKESDSPPAATSPFDEYAGIFETSIIRNGRRVCYSFASQGTALWVQLGGGTSAKLHVVNAQKDTFKADAEAATFQFDRINGSVVSVRVIQGTQEIKATKLGSRTR